MRGSAYRVPHLCRGSRQQLLSIAGDASRKLPVPWVRGIRLDSGVYPGWTVPLEYDPLLARCRCGAERAKLPSAGCCARSRSITWLASKRMSPSSGRSLKTRSSEPAICTPGFIDEFFRRKQPAAVAGDAEVHAVAALVAAIHAGASRQPAAGGARNGSSPVGTAGQGKGCCDDSAREARRSASAGVCASTGSTAAIALVLAMRRSARHRVEAVEAGHLLRAGRTAAVTMSRSSQGRTTGMSMYADCISPSRLPIRAMLHESGRPYRRMAPAK